LSGFFDAVDSDILVRSDGNAFVPAGQPFFPSDRSIGPADFYALPDRVTLWFGPFPDDELRHRLAGRYEDACWMADPNSEFHTTVVGAYVRVRRLRQAPVHKLSDWYDLLPGEQMMLHPQPSQAEVRAALSRTKYLRTRGLQFSASQKDDSSLWASREAAAPEAV
jgi:hypothetical protein